MITRFAAIVAVLVAAVAVVLFGVNQSSTGTAPSASAPKGGNHPVQKITI